MTTRTNRRQRQAHRSLNLERMEHRRLMAGDVTSGLDQLIPDSIMDGQAAIVIPDHVKHGKDAIIPDVIMQQQDAILPDSIMHGKDAILPDSIMRGTDSTIDINAVTTMGTVSGINDAPAGTDNLLPDSIMHGKDAIIPDVIMDVLALDVAQLPKFDIH